MNYGSGTMKKRNLTKHTLRLEEGQLEELALLHPALPVNEVVRRILSAYITKARAQLGASQTKIEIEVEV
jgi:hypothetical protein